MPRILVIDDQPHVRAAILAILQTKGLEVVGADNGASALNAFDRERFDLAIVDLFMPGMDGVKLIKALRERNEKLPVIAISGVHLRGSGRTALDYFPLAPDLTGIICLQKPFRPPALLAAIRKAVGLPMPASAESCDPL